MKRRQQIVHIISLIRAALKQQGYPLRKRPRQAVWTIQVNPDKRYRLTYQPYPISAWLLHPLDGEGDRQRVLTIIQTTLNEQTIDSPTKVL